MQVLISQIHKHPHLSAEQDQLAEHEPCTLRVVGSSPTLGAAILGQWVGRVMPPSASEAQLFRRLTLLSQKKKRDALH